MIKNPLPVLIALIFLYFGLLLFGNDVLGVLGSSFSGIKENAEVLGSLTESLAILVAGYWAYNRFIKERGDFSFPKIEHSIKHYVLKEGMIYLSVFVTVTNQGKTKLDLGNGQVFIRQVLPLDPRIQKLTEDSIAKSGDEAIRLGKVKDLFIDSGQRVGWITLGERGWNQVRNKLKELEPGQSREIQFDFLLIGDDDVEVIEAISYFAYAKSSWELATLYSLEKSMVSTISTDKA